LHPSKVPSIEFWLLSCPHREIGGGFFLPLTEIISGKPGGGLHFPETKMIYKQRLKFGGKFLFIFSPFSIILFVYLILDDKFLAGLHLSSGQKNNKTFLKHFSNQFV